MHLFIFSIEKMYCLHKTTSAVSCVKPNASQWEATLRDDVGFATVYRRIYRRKFLTLSNQTSRYIRECIRIFIICASVVSYVTFVLSLFNPCLSHWCLGMAVLSKYGNTLVYVLMFLLDVVSEFVGFLSTKLMFCFKLLNVLSQI